MREQLTSAIGTAARVDALLVLIDETFMDTLEANLQYNFLTLQDLVKDLIGKLDTLENAMRREAAYNESAS